MKFKILICILLPICTFGQLFSQTKYDKAQDLKTVRNTGDITVLKTDLANLSKSLTALTNKYLKDSIANNIRITTLSNRIAVLEKWKDSIVPVDPAVLVVKNGLLTIPAISLIQDRVIKLENKLVVAPKVLMLAPKGIQTVTDYIIVQ